MPKRSASSGGLLAGLRTLLRDERGVAAVYIGLSSVLIFGATALAFDIGRVMSLQTELQSAADAAALAGAAELDGQTNAISRAKAAAGCPNGGNTVQGAFGTNSQTFATDGNGTSVSVVFCTFFSSLTSPDPPLLPPNNSALGGNSTTTDSQAAFIKVVVQQRSLANAFITMVGGPQIASTTAVATAGFSQTICQTLPLMICNPDETAGNTNFSPPTGEELVVKPGPGNAWAPGNYGFTSAPPGAKKVCGFNGNNGSNDLSILLAQDQPIGCLSTTLNTRTGVPLNMSVALNVRFDLYQVPGNSVNKTDSCFAPAPDVTKGWLPGTGNGNNGGPCNPTQVIPPDATAFPFPQDTCFTLGTNCDVSGVLGKGDWDINTYWAYNHTSSTGCAVPPCYPSALTTFANTLTPAGITPSGIPSRYATYLYEINNNLIPANGTPALHQENGAPACYSGSAANETNDRRLINVAVVNCIQQGVQGNSTNIRPVAVLQSFMNIPSDGNTGNIYMEVIKKIQPGGSDNILHNIVQLYR
jgi:Flp pilus assembly protein TadG